MIDHNPHSAGDACDDPVTAQLNVTIDRDPAQQESLDWADLSASRLAVLDDE
ncbi:hypothetical protein [Microbacterium sp.]|uniref:hypothetical protein n=1 Tax=Microbacterium sp. TaxID=51671 RepID=UPI0039E64C26